LNGENTTIIGLSIISTIVRDALLPEAKMKKMNVVERNFKSVGISIIFGLIGSELVPDWMEAGETYWMRSNYIKFKLLGTKDDPQELCHSYGSNKETIGRYLANRRGLREYGFVMYASLAKMALDRIDGLNYEQKHLIMFHQQSQTQNKSLSS